MGYYLNRWVEALEGGLIPFVSGSAIGLLAITPDGVLAPIWRLIIGIALIVIAILWITVRVVYDRWQQYREDRKEVDKYFDVIPRTVRFKAQSRTIQVDESGNSLVTERITLVNESDKIIPSISKPAFTDVSSDVHDGSEGYESNIEIRRVIIDNEEYPDPGGCYRLEGLLYGDDTTQERGYLTIPLTSIGGLPPRSDSGRSEIPVKIEYFVKGGLESAFEGGDYLATDVYHPTDSVKVEIIPPEGAEILLNDSDSHPNAIDVRDIHAEITDQQEKSSVNKPRIREDSVVNWVIEHPKLNYRYEVKFLIPS